jgi:hypothetical protein
MTTAISTSDPNMDRVGDWLGWAIQASLLRSTSVRTNLAFLRVMRCGFDWRLEFAT